MTDARPEPSALARALGRIPCGLFLATVETPDGPVGFVASFVQQVGFEPPTVALAVDVLEGLKKALGERVKTVRVSDRLTDSPACLVVEEDEMGSQMRRLLKSAGQAVPEAAPILEVNGNHVLLRRFEQEQDGERRQDLAEVLLAQAKLAEGDPLDDPAAYLRCMNRLLAELA